MRSLSKVRCVLCLAAELLIGTTIAGYGNGTAGSGAEGLSSPRGIHLMPTDETLYVSDSGNCRVQRFQFGSRAGVTVAGGNGCGASLNQMDKIWSVYVDTAKNAYVGDFNKDRAMRWPLNATQGSIIANGDGITGVTIDQYGHFYTSLSLVNVILRNNITVVAGTYNISGNTQTLLNYPRGIFFDQNTSSLFVCDTYNYRILQFRMNSSIGITVAGGNGRGNGPHQLNNPGAVWVSSKTGSIYIADTANHRIQRWKINDTEGVTIAGKGTSGVDPTRLNYPSGVATDTAETRLYVSEQGNHRIQRFDLLDYDTS